jgi:hypothetical protein
VEESKGSPQKVKVVDRRKFTPEGEPRDRERPRPQVDEPGQVTQPRDDTARSRDAGATAAADEQDDRTRSTAETSSDFMGLVAMLAHQAEILLVGAENLPAQPEEARTVIDFLGALEAKTAGNLSREEQQVLSSVVYQLRALYLQKKS